MDRDYKVYNFIAALDNYKVDYKNELSKWETFTAA